MADAKGSEMRSEVLIYVYVLTQDEFAVLFSGDSGLGDVFVFYEEDECFGICM